MITLDFDGQQLVITADYLDREAVRTINGVTASGAQRWTLPASIPTYIDAELLVKYEGGQITDACAQWWNHVETVADGLIKLKDATTFSITTLGTVDLTPEKAADASFLSNVGSGFVLNEMRTGKTYTLFLTVQKLDAFPLLVATLPNTTFEIEKQARQAFPDKTIAVLAKGLNVTQRRKVIEARPDILILGHNLLEMHSRIETWGGNHKAKKGQKSKTEQEREKGKYDPKELNGYGFKCIAIDEGHAIEKPETAVTRAAWALGAEIPHRFVITGTPAANKEIELWPLLRFCYPKLFRSKKNWIDRYINYPTNRYGLHECKALDTVGNDGVKRLSAIKPEVRAEWGRIFDLMHVRRTRTQGPEKEYRVIPVELPKAQLKAYRDLAEHSIALVDGELVTATDSMTLRHRLAAFAAGTPVIKDDKVVALEMPSAKIETLLDVLAESEDKAIVVCEGRPLADLTRSVLVEKGIATVAIVGGMTQEQQTAAEAEFQTGAAKVIVINKAGAFGKELSAAKRTIFLERSFDYKFSSQAESRNTSSAQEAATVEVVDIFAKGTLDEAVREGFLNKDENMHERLKDKDWVRQSMYGSSR